MSQVERYSWVSLITTGLILVFFNHRMLDGWQVVDQPVRLLVLTYFMVIGLLIVFESVVVGFIAGMGGRDDLEKDERDLAIEAKAEQWTSWFMLAALNVMVIHLLGDLAYPDNIFPRIDLTEPVMLFYLLMTILFVSTLLKRIATLVLYGRHGAAG